MIRYLIGCLYKLTAIEILIHIINDNTLVFILIKSNIKTNKYMNYLINCLKPANIIVSVCIKSDKNLISLIDYYRYSKENVITCKKMNVDGSWRGYRTGLERKICRIRTFKTEFQIYNYVVSTSCSLRRSCSCRPDEK